jgi:Uma2 family endonuclease
MTTRTLMTAEEFAALPDDEPCRRDLVEGEVWTMAAASTKHGLIAGRLYIRVSIYVEQHEPGLTYVAETGFTLGRNPDTVLGGDISFVRAERLTPADILDSGFMEIAPDLVAEVVSPGDRAGEIAKTVELYLRAGVRLVWEVDPRRRVVKVHRAGSAERTLNAGDVLDGVDVLPGFSLPLATLWI